MNNIAQLMVNVTNTILLEHVSQWMKHRHPEATINVRVGTGSATNLTHHKGKKNFTLTYGVKMIQSKTVSKGTTAAWTTGREIVERGYFAGNLTMQTALAHTVLHEFAHLIQRLKDTSARDGMHNALFYEILDRMYASGMGEKIYQALIGYNEFAQLRFESNAEPLTKLDIVKGNRVFYQENGGIEKSAFVTKVNKNTVSSKQGRVTLRIPYHMITRVA